MLQFGGCCSNDHLHNKSDPLYTTSWSCCLEKAHTHWIETDWECYNNLYLEAPHALSVSPSLSLFVCVGVCMRVATLPVLFM